MRILLAEDERRLAGAIARGLRREGMAVDITHDGASALVKARVVDYDVVVLDGYLPKPFHWPELVARMRALARRAGRARPPVLRHGDLELDPGRREARRGDRVLELTPKEFGVLEALLAAAGQAVSTEELLARV